MSFCSEEGSCWEFPLGFITPVDSAEGFDIPAAVLLFTADIESSFKFVISFAVLKEDLFRDNKLFTRRWSSVCSIEEYGMVDKQNPQNSYRSFQNEFREQGRYHLCSALHVISTFFSNFTRGGRTFSSAFLKAIARYLTTESGTGERVLSLIARSTPNVFVM